MRKNKTGEKKNGYTLMILDDDQNILDALGANFRSMGYEVETQSIRCGRWSSLRSGIMTSFCWTLL